MTTDIPAATAFYSKIAGWGTQEFDMGPNGKYQMWVVDNAPIGGVMTQTPKSGAPPMPPHWLGYVAVPNTDETVKQAESLGGRVISPPMDIPTVGRFAIIADPQGAAIAVFTPLPSSTGMDYSPQVGKFSWHELMTTDHDAAWSFYSKLFDWEKTGESDMGAIGMYVMFGLGGDHRASDAPNAGACGGMFNMTPEMKMPPNWVYYIQVDSVDATAEAVKSSGGQLLNGPMEVPGGDRIAQCMDPQGGMFAIHEVKKS
jgi:predicted enzyme related to lactoylglutathione lyase